MACELRRIGGLTALCFGMSAPWALAQPAGAPAPAAAPPSPDAVPPVASDPELTRPLTPLDQFTLAPPTAAAAAPAPPPEVRYAVEIRGLKEVGLDRTFRQLSSLDRGRGKAASELQIGARAADDQTLIQRLLRAHGYYQGQAQ